MIEISDVTKRYGHTVAVDHLSFEVRPGEVTGLLGSNGPGSRHHADGGRARRPNLRPGVVPVVAVLLLRRSAPCARFRERSCSACL